MGSFDFTCCVSGLPVHVGDPVKWFILTENPYDDDNLVCYMHDMWFPRTWPLNAKYNDYGSIEEFDEKGPGVFSVIEGLKYDMVEVGWGDNQCHDVPAEKGMSFSATLEAIWEKRIQVTRENRYDPFDKAMDEVDKLLGREPLTERRKKFMTVNEDGSPRFPNDEPENLPTMWNVKQTLLKAGFKVAGPESGANGYLIEEKEYGWVRVRFGGYSTKIADLEKVLPTLQEKYAAVITVGSGNYSDDGEIQVMPKPMKREKHCSFLYDRDRNKKPLYVYQAMILGDVWDEMLKLNPKGHWGDENHSYDKFRSDAQDLWDEMTKEPTKEELEMPFMVRMKYRDDDRVVGSLVGKSAVPFTMGLSEHFYIVRDQHRKTPFDKKQIDEFLDNVAGFSFLHMVLSPTRYWWRPSFSCGPQFGEYGQHKKLMAAYNRAATSAKKRHDW